MERRKNDGLKGKKLRKLNNRDNKDLKTKTGTDGRFTLNAL